MEVTLPFLFLALASLLAAQCTPTFLSQWVMMLARLLSCVLAFLMELGRVIFLSSPMFLALWPFLQMPWREKKSRPVGPSYRHEKYSLSVSKYAAALLDKATWTKYVRCTDYPSIQCAQAASWKISPTLEPERIEKTCSPTPRWLIYTQATNRNSYWLLPVLELFNSAANISGRGGERSSGGAEHARCTHAPGSSRGRLDTACSGWWWLMTDDAGLFWEKSTAG
jgi:hypothetical protein